MLDLKAEALARPHAHRAGWDVVGALRDLAEPAPPADEPSSEPVSPRAPPRHAAPAVETGVSTNVVFKPKVRAREILGTGLLASFLATLVAAYLAYDDPTNQTVGIAATLGVLTLVIWAARATSPITTMSVIAGQLKVRIRGQRHVFDLTSHYTPIEVQGNAGRRGWRVLFGRGTMPPFVVDSSIVDARHFMEVLRRYRPD
jgi:hypothetical protein